MISVSAPGGGRSAPGRRRRSPPRSLARKTSRSATSRRASDRRTSRSSTAVSWPAGARGWSTGHRRRSGTRRPRRRPSARGPRRRPSSTRSRSRRVRGRCRHRTAIPRGRREPAAVSPAGRPAPGPGSRTVEPEQAFRVHRDRVQRTAEGDERRDGIPAPASCPWSDHESPPLVAQHSAAGVLVRRVLEAGAAAAEARHAGVQGASVDGQPGDRVCVPRRAAVLPAARAQAMDAAARRRAALPGRRVEVPSNDASEHTITVAAPGRPWSTNRGAVPVSTPNHAVRSLPWLPHGAPCSKPRLNPWRFAGSNHETTSPSTVVGLAAALTQAATVTSALRARDAAPPVDRRRGTAQPADR